MPFQDVDEVSAEPTRTPSAIERALRKIFVEDWSLKLLSLAITLVLWLVVTGQNEPVTTHVNVQLSFVRPQSLEISNDPPKSVDVTLTGSRSKLDNLSALDLVATIDLTDQRAGERVLRLSERAELPLPHGVKIDAFLPGAIPIRLEPIIEKELPTEPKVEGQAASGYEVYAVTPSQPTVTVRGPASHVNALDKAPTETIFLMGQNETFSATNVAIDIPDPKVDVVDAAVNVQVEIGERRMEKTFADISVSAPPGMKTLPKSVTVSVSGPAHIMEGLKKEELRVVLNTALEPRLEIPPPLAGRVVLKSLKPDKFTLLR